MPAKLTRRKLEDRVSELEEENETLQEKLDSITEILGEEDDDD